MPCSCPGRISYVRSTSVEIVSNEVVVTILNEVISNGQSIYLCVAQSMPVGVTELMPVVLSVNGATIDLRTLRGNAVYADQIRSRRAYPLTLATDINSAVVMDNTRLFRTRHPFEPIPVPGPTPPGP